MTLTPESADVLGRIPEMKQWKVAPTMTRGAKGRSLKQAMARRAQKARKALTNPKKKRKLRRAQQTSKKSEKKKSAPVHLDTEDVSEATFRRTAQGREAIRAQILELNELDRNAFPKAPAFSPQGMCKLKFQGAEKFTWDDVLRNAAPAIEHMHLPLDYHVFFLLAGGGHVFL